MLGSANTSITSLSSASAKLLLNLIGVTSTTKSLIKESPTKEYFIKLYTKKVRDYAKSKDMWNDFADNLKVVISDEGKISIIPTGTPDELRIIEALEYGTPSTPPVSVIRVLEEELRQEHVFNKKRIGL